MVIDCGGGTVDITVHEMTTQKGYLLELYKATGGPFGSVGLYAILIISLNNKLAKIISLVGLSLSKIRFIITY